jgi:glycosyltransferase involved in cell wall biosynthesis
MTSQPTITAITSARNASMLIERTVSSIVTQSVFTSGRAQLQYLVRDGSSTDDTIARALAAAGEVEITVVSEPDQGMYDALANGLRSAAGDVVFYLNAGDMLFPGALDVVLDVMEQTGARWLTGYTTLFNIAGSAIYTKPPFRFRRRLMRAGVYGRHLPFLQQESTFWARELMASVNLDVLRTFRLAGDQYLWSCFSSLEEVTVVRALLGGFTLHGDHLSDDLNAYWAEVRPMDSVGLRGRVFRYLDQLLWLAPDRIKKLANKSHFIIFDEASGLWR